MDTFETKISTSRGESRIVVGNGLLAQLGVIAAEVVMGRRVVVVTDENVRPLYLAPVEASLAASGFSVLDRGRLCYTALICPAVDLQISTRRGITE